MRISVRSQEEAEPKSPVKGCPVNLNIREGRWFADIKDPDACAPTVVKMEELGPEARINLARHLKTDDPLLDDDIRTMRKRKAQSGG